MLDPQKFLNAMPSWGASVDDWSRWEDAVWSSTTTADMTTTTAAVPPPPPMETFSEWTQRSVPDDPMPTDPATAWKQFMDWKARSDVGCRMPAGETQNPDAVDPQYPPLAVGLENSGRIRYINLYRSQLRNLFGIFVAASKQCAEIVTDRSAGPPYWPVELKVMLREHGIDIERPFRVQLTVGQPFECFLWHEEAA